MSIINNNNFKKDNNSWCCQESRRLVKLLYSIPQGRGRGPISTSISGTDAD